MLLVIPMRTHNPLNGSQGTTRAGNIARARKRASMRQTAYLHMLAYAQRPRNLRYWEITLTRVAPRAVSDEAIAATLKAVRDGVADWLGVDDDDPRLMWRYSQRRGKAREYAVTIEMVQRDRW